MKYRLALGLIFSLFFSVSRLSYAKVYSSPKDVPNPVKATHTYISNPDHLISAPQEAELEQILEAHTKKTTNEIAVVILDKIESLSPKEMAHQLFNLWGVGKAKQDNGLLILVSLQDRRIEFETGYGLEGPLPDVVCKRIQMSEIVPRFKEGNYYEGLRAGIEKTIQILETPETAIKGDKPYPQSTATDESSSETISDSTSDIDNHFYFHFGPLLFILTGLLMWIYSNAATKSNLKLIASGTLAGLITIGPLFSQDQNSQNLALVILGYCLLALLYGIYSIERVTKDNSKEQRSKQIQIMNSLGWGRIIAAFIPLAWMFYWLYLRQRINSLRFTPFSCPHCNHRCKLIPQEEESAYLQTEDIKEESLGAVNYDVWLCQECKVLHKVVIPAFYSEYVECQNCKRKGFHLVKSEVLEHPTTYSEGRSAETYQCEICQVSQTKIISLARISDSSDSSNSSSIGSSSFGGDDSSFGGGSSGGGGAGSSW